MNSDSTYHKFAQYYDLCVGDFDADLPVYKSLCHAQESILEVGCGTGRVLQSFLRDGFVVTGIDISQEMLGLAKRKLQVFQDQGSLRIYRHDLRKQPLPDKYERVLVTFFTFNYILERPETFLQHLRQSMTQDSSLIMDLFFPKTLAHPELDNVWTTNEFKRHGRAVTLRDRRILSNNIEERTQIYQEQGESIEIVTARRYYPPEEILHILHAGGFQEIQFAQGYESSAFDETIDSEQLRQNFIVKATKKG